MATLVYRARDDAGRLLRGQAEAQSPGELRSRLREQGLWLVEAKARTRRGTSRTRVSRQELILFTFHLQTVVAGGIPLLTGLNDLIHETKSGHFRAVIEELRSQIEGGSTLAQALARFPRVFPASYVHMVEGGEASGSLDRTLERLVALLEWREELKAQIRQLVTYPIIVICFMLGLVGLMLGFVLPRFRGILESLQVELPWSTRFLLSASEFVRHQWILLLIAMAALVAVASTLPRLPRARLLLDAMNLRLPVLGRLQLALAASQIAHFLGAFIETGVPIGLGLELVSGIVDNRQVAAGVDRARGRVLSGETLAGAFRQVGILPPLVLRMLSIGEESGTLPESLKKAADYYDREIPRQVKQLFDLVAPVLTVVLGAGLLFTVLSVLLPIYRMYSAIGATP